MENELSEVEPLSSIAQTVLKFVSRYGMGYLGLCLALHIGTLLHRLRCEQLFAPLGFGLIPLFLTGWYLQKEHAPTRQLWKAIMRRLPAWMKRLTLFLVAYFVLLLLWQWANRPEEYSKEMDKLTPIFAGQMFSIVMAGCALSCLRLAVWRLNSQTPESNG